MAFCKETGLFSAAFYLHFNIEGNTDNIFKKCFKKINNLHVLRFGNILQAPIVYRCVSLYPVFTLVTAWLDVYESKYILMIYSMSEINVYFVSSH